MFSNFPHRFFNTTNIAFDSKTNIISRKLGIPEVPKKPITPYLRYLNEVRPSIKVKSPREAVTIAAAQWKKLDENQKQKYKREFENDKVVARSTMNTIKLVNILINHFRLYGLKKKKPMIKN